MKDKGNVLVDTSSVSHNFKPMGVTYLKFKAPTRQKSKSNFFTEIITRAITKILRTLLPIANPDFEKRIDEVDSWLVEFEDELPNREVGLDNNGLTIVIMPYSNNYGYWTDNILKLEDFKRLFRPDKISAQEFNIAWNRLDVRKPTA